MFKGKTSSDVYSQFRKKHDGAEEEEEKIYVFSQNENK